MTARRAVAQAVSQEADPAARAANHAVPAQMVHAAIASVPLVVAAVRLQNTASNTKPKATARVEGLKLDQPVRQFVDDIVAFGEILGKHYAYLGDSLCHAFAGAAFADMAD